MSKELNKLLEQTLQRRTNKDYHKNQSPTIFHVSEAASCSYKVLKDRENPPKNNSNPKLFSPDKSYFSIGRAYENYIYYNLPKSNGDYYWKRHYGVNIPLAYGMGFTGSPDIVYECGQIRIPIEIKTTIFSDLNFFSSTDKLLIQGCSYGYGMMSDYWYLLAASKSSPQQTFFKKKTHQPVYQKQSIDEFLKRKFIDLTIADKEKAQEYQYEFTPMFKFECKNQSNTCDYYDNCPYRN